MDGDVLIGELEAEIAQLSEQQAARRDKKQPLFGGPDSPKLEPQSPGRGTNFSGSRAARRELQIDKMAEVVSQEVVLLDTLLESARKKPRRLSGRGSDDETDGGEDEQLGARGGKSKHPLPGGSAQDKNEHGAGDEDDDVEEGHVLTKRRLDLHVLSQPGYAASHVLSAPPTPGGGSYADIHSPQRARIPSLPSVDGSDGDGAANAPDAGDELEPPPLALPARMPHRTQPAHHPPKATARRTDADYAWPGAERGAEQHMHVDEEEDDMERRMVRLGLAPQRGERIGAATSHTGGAKPISMPPKGHHQDENLQRLLQQHYRKQHQERQQQQHKQQQDKQQQQQQQQQQKKTRSPQLNISEEEMALRVREALQIRHMASRILRAQGGAVGGGVHSASSSRQHSPEQGNGGRRESRTGATQTDLETVLDRIAQEHHQNQQQEERKQQQQQQTVVVQRKVGPRISVSPAMKASVHVDTNGDDLVSDPGASLAEDLRASYHSLPPSRELVGRPVNKHLIHLYEKASTILDGLLSPKSNTSTKAVDHVELEPSGTIPDMPESIGTQTPFRTPRHSNKVLNVPLPDYLDLSPMRDSGSPALQFLTRRLQRVRAIIAEGERSRRTRGHTPAKGSGQGQGGAEGGTRDAQIPTTAIPTRPQQQEQADDHAGAGAHDGGAAGGRRYRFPITASMSPATRPAPGSLLPVAPTIASDWKVKRIEDTSVMASTAQSPVAIHHQHQQQQQPERTAIGSTTSTSPVAQRRLDFRATPTHGNGGGGGGGGASLVLSAARIAKLEAALGNLRCSVSHLCNMLAGAGGSSGGSNNNTSNSNHTRTSSSSGGTGLGSLADVLHADDALVLLECVPTAQEKRALRQARKDGTVLTEAEKFSLSLGGVPDAMQRLHAWHCKCTCWKALGSMDTQLEIILLACKELRSSDKLKHIMSTIQTIGEALNHQQQKQQQQQQQQQHTKDGVAPAAALAPGFRVRGLDQLSLLRTADGSRSLLDVIVSRLAIQDPRALTVADELANVTPAAHVFLDSVLAQFRDLQSDVRACMRLPANEYLGGRDDAFTTEIHAFAREASTHLAALQLVLRSAERAARATLLHLNEDPSEMSLQELASLVARFLVQVKAVALRMQRH